MVADRALRKRGVDVVTNRLQPRLISCLLWIGLTVAPGLLLACPTTLPEGMSGTSVGQDLATNGLAMSIT